MFEVATLGGIWPEISVGIGIGVAKSGDLVVADPDRHVLWRLQLRSARLRRLCAAYQVHSVACLSKCLCLRLHLVAKCSALSKLGLLLQCWVHFQMQAWAKAMICRLGKASAASVLSPDLMQLIADILMNRLPSRHLAGV